MRPRQSVTASTCFFAAVVSCGGDLHGRDGARDAEAPDDVRVADASAEASGSEASIDSDACFNSPCPVTLASEQDHPGPIAVDATHVYWGDETAIMSVPLDGGTPVTLAPANSPTFIAVDPANLYWADSAGFVLRVPLVGGAPLTLASNQQPVSGLTTDAISVYWTQAETTGPNTGTVVSLPVGGGTPTTLATGQFAPSRPGVSGGFLYWANAGYACCGGLSPTEPGAIVKLPVGGGTITTIVGDQQEPTDVTVNGGSIFWLSGGMSQSPAVVEVNQLGGAPVTIAVDPDVPYLLALYDTTIYWASGGSPNVEFIKWNSGDSKPVHVAIVPGATDMAVGSTSIYWTSGGINGALMSLPR